MNVLVVDVGGTHVKILATGQPEPREFPSGPTLTPQQMVAGVRSSPADGRTTRCRIGYPGPSCATSRRASRTTSATGWVAFDYAKAFGCPVRIINDAAMQALGSYQGGKMLFLALGTGLGSALIADGVVVPMELAHLPYREATFEDYVGARALERDGKKKWRKHVADVVARLIAALRARRHGAGRRQCRAPEGSCRRAAGSATTPTPSAGASGCGSSDAARTARRQRTAAIAPAAREATTDDAGSGDAVDSDDPRGRRWPPTATACATLHAAPAVRRRPGARHALDGRRRRALSRLLEEPHHRRDPRAAAAARRANRGLRERIDAMFRGDKINVTENRAVLHVALRAPRGESIVVDGAGRRARSARGARPRWPRSPTACAAATGRAIPASASATSSTSASAAPTSGR